MSVDNNYPKLNTIIQYTLLQHYVIAPTISTNLTEGKTLYIYTNSLRYFTNISQNGPLAA